MDKYGMSTTSVTLVEKLSRGEDWDRFCKVYYDPIINRFNAINKAGIKKYGKLTIPETDVGDAVNAIIEKLKRKLQTSYDPNRGRLKDWLSAVIKNAIEDYRRENARPQPDPDAPDPIDTPAPTPSDEEWIMFLLNSAFMMALKRPWSKRDKEINKIIAENLLENVGKPKSERLSDGELARKFNVSEVNLRKIRQRFLSEVRGLYDQFKNDDPDFFAFMYQHRISYDDLLEDYLSKNGAGDDIDREKKAFSERNGVLD